MNNNNYIGIRISDFEYDSFSEVINEDLYYATELSGHMYSVEFLEENTEQILNTIETELFGSTKLKKITLNNVRDAIIEEYSLIAYDDSSDYEDWKGGRY